VPLYARGYIASYGEGRTCSEPSCETTLSRYNKTDLCWMHAQQRDLTEHHVAIGSARRSQV
jgi:hypothetical protein